MWSPSKQEPIPLRTIVSESNNSGQRLPQAASSYKARSQQETFTLSVQFSKTSVLIALAAALRLSSIVKRNLLSHSHSLR